MNTPLRAAAAAAIGLGSDFDDTAGITSRIALIDPTPTNDRDAVAAASVNVTTMRTVHRFVRQVAVAVTAEAEAATLHTTATPSAAATTTAAASATATVVRATLRFTSQTNTIASSSNGTTTVGGPLPAGRCADGVDDTTLQLLNGLWSFVGYPVLGIGVLSCVLTLVVAHRSVSLRGQPATAMLLVMASAGLAALAFGLVPAVVEYQTCAALRIGSLLPHGGCQALTALAYLAVTLHAWIELLAAIERLWAVRAPLAYMCCCASPALVVASIVGASAVPIAVAALAATDHEPNDGGLCVAAAQGLPGQASQVAFAIAYAVLPPVAAVICDALLLHAARRGAGRGRRRRRTSGATSIDTSTVTLSSMAAVVAATAANKSGTDEDGAVGGGEEEVTWRTLAADYKLTAITHLGVNCLSLFIVAPIALFGGVRLTDPTIDAHPDRRRAMHVAWAAARLAVYLRCGAPFVLYLSLRSGSRAAIVEALSGAQKQAPATDAAKSKGGGGGSAQRASSLAAARTSVAAVAMRTAAAASIAAISLRRRSAAGTAGGTAAAACPAAPHSPVTTTAATAAATATAAGTSSPGRSDPASPGADARREGSSVKRSPITAGGGGGGLAAPMANNMAEPEESDGDDPERTKSIVLHVMGPKSVVAMSEPNFNFGSVAGVGGVGGARGSSAVGVGGGYGVGIGSGVGGVSVGRVGGAGGEHVDRDNGGRRGVNPFGGDGVEHSTRTHGRGRGGDNPFGEIESRISGYDGEHVGRANGGGRGGGNPFEGIQSRLGGGGSRLGGGGSRPGVGGNGFVGSEGRIDEESMCSMSSLAEQRGA